MDFELTPQQKIDTLTATRKNIKSEIFNILIRVGVDPDTFDETDLSGFNPVMVGERERIESLISGLAMIESKIASLQ
jgi:hypothetical protein